MVDKTGRRVYTEYNSNRDGIHTKLMRGHRAKEDIMRTYVLNAAEIAIEENGGRINCFEIEDFKAFTKTLEGAGYSWEMDSSTDWIIIKKELKALQMQYEEGGEWFEIWETRTDDLEAAWEEMDQQPEEGGHIRFKGSEKFMVVNGGF